MLVSHSCHRIRYIYIDFLLSRSLPHAIPLFICRMCRRPATCQNTRPLTDTTKGSDSRSRSKPYAAIIAYMRPYTVRCNAVCCMLYICVCFSCASFVRLASRHAMHMCMHVCACVSVFTATAAAVAAAAAARYRSPVGCSILPECGLENSQLSFDHRLVSYPNVCVEHTHNFKS